MSLNLTNIFRLIYTPKSLFNADKAIKEDFYRFRVYSSMVEHAAHNDAVVGSIPAKPKLCFFIFT